MGVADALQLASQFGLSGVLMAYLFWRERNDREDRKRREEAAAEERKEQRETVKQDAASRLEHATAITALATIVQGLGKRNG